MSQTEANSILKDMLTKEISPEMSEGYANEEMSVTRQSTSTSNKRLGHLTKMSTDQHAPKPKLESALVPESKTSRSRPESLFHHTASHHQGLTTSC